MKQQSPSRPVAQQLFDMAHSAYQAGRFADALGLFQSLLQKHPTHAASWYVLGQIYVHLRQRPQALHALENAVRYNPREPGFHLSLGLLYEEHGQVSKALECYQQVILLDKTHALAYRCMGQALQKLNRMSEAMQCYRQAITLNPRDAAAYNNLGRLLMEEGQPEEAVRQFEQALALQPDYPNAQNNLACALNKLGQTQSAMDLFHHILKTHPENIDAHLNRGIQCLLFGDYAQGWPEYEWRLKTPSFPPIAFPKPMWDGSPLAGKTILVIAEQGFGDTLQFLRFLPLLKRQGATVIFACQPALHALLKTCRWIDTLVVRSLEMVDKLDYDTYIYLMSLPDRIQTTLQTIPQATDLLSIPNELITHWQTHQITTVGLNVGITWAITSSTSPTRRYRTCPLEAFASIGNVPQIHLYSLQKGVLMDSAGVGFQLKDLSAELSDFLETAAAILAMDLVITVDTAVAHLAGTLQKPVWVLLPHMPDWRWLLHRDDSPWYPSAKLYRQSSPGDWPGVFQQLLPDLTALATQKTC